MCYYIFHMVTMSMLVTEYTLSNKKYIMKNKCINFKRQFFFPLKMRAKVKEIKKTERRYYGDM